MRKTRAAMTAAAAALAAPALVVPAAAQTKWNLPAAYPADNPHSVNLIAFAKDVGDATGGKLKITVHANASLFKAPEIKRAAKVYLDFHLSLVGPGVAHQYLVYAKGGHFTEMVPVTESGCLTLYRLPFWHYTTPLQAKPKQEKKAARWVLLGTFLFAP